MLLEAYQLLKNRIGQGHAENQSHENFSTNVSRAYNTWRLILEKDGSIHGLELMQDAEQAGYWSLVEGTSAKTKRFPALRPTLPLLQLAQNDPLRDRLSPISDNNVKKITNELLEFVAPTESPENSDKSVCYNPQDFLDAWETKAKVILDWKSTANSELTYLQECVKSFGLFCGLDESKKWTHSEEQRIPLGLAVGEKLLLAFVSVLRKPADAKKLKAIVDFILGKPEKIKTGNKKGQYKIEVSTQLCIDLHLPESLGSTIYTPHLAKIAVKCLSASNAGGQPGVCSISGKPDALLKTKFPDWDSGLFKTPPFSKFRDAPCNQRYGKFGLDGLDISSVLARSLVGGLNDMIKPTQEWKTWVKLHNGRFKREKGKKPIPLKDLMLAYPSLDIDDLTTIDVFTHRRAENTDEEADRATQFVSCAENLCLSLKGKSTLASGDADYMRIMLVRAVSKGQIQLSYSATPTIKNFVAAIEAWTQSGNNLPHGIAVPLPFKGSPGEYRWRLPRLLFPEEISLLLTKQWNRDGSENTYIQGPSVGMVLDLFLRKQGVWEETARELLEMTLARNTSLLIGASHVLHRDDRQSLDLWKKFIAKAQFGKEKRRPDYALAQTISLLGSLLYAMNSKLQDYVNEPPYLVGKLLAMMDELHRCYCMVVRDRHMPNSLIGNGLLRRATDSPALALNDLCERSPIYIGWAKTAEITDNMSKENEIAIKSARKVLRLAQPLSEQLHGDPNLEKELSATGKAHLFLGYLSPVLGKDEGETPPASGALASADISGTI
jgi:hypothetical protein